jgi:hypothetical protein
MLSHRMLPSLEYCRRGMDLASIQREDWQIGVSPRVSCGPHGWGLDVGTYTSRFLVLVAVVMSTNAFVGATTSDPRRSHSGDESAAASPADESRYPIFSIDTIALLPPDLEFAGREVSADEIDVTRVDRDGFWVSATGGKREVFVIPAEGSLISVRRGEAIDIHGEVRFVRIKPNHSRTGNSESDLRPYVYAYTVRPAS